MKSLAFNEHTLLLGLRQADGLTTVITGHRAKYLWPFFIVFILYSQQGKQDNSYQYNKSAYE
jgi:hypothetical protein